MADFTPNFGDCEEWLSNPIYPLPVLSGDDISMILDSSVRPDIVNHLDPGQERDNDTDPIAQPGLVGLNPLRPAVERNNAVYLKEGANVIIEPHWTQEAMELDSLDESATNPEDQQEEASLDLTFRLPDDHHNDVAINSLNNAIKDNWNLAPDEPAADHEQFAPFGFGEQQPYGFGEPQLAAEVRPNTSAKKKKRGRPPKNVEEYYITKKPAKTETPQKREELKKQRKREQEALASKRYRDKMKLQRLQATGGR